VLNQRLKGKIGLKTKLSYFCEWMHLNAMFGYKHLIITCWTLGISLQILYSQTARISGKVTADGKPLEYAKVNLKGTSWGTITDTNGFYLIEQIPPGKYVLRISFIGYEKLEKTVILHAYENLTLNFDFTNYALSLNEVVISGTMKEINRLESSVPVEAYTQSFFKKNPSPNIYEVLQNVNGVRPQLNCQVCNTGDIHINGLEGPYTMVLIDGMPIVSGLSTVYGLMGIPNSLIERIEIIK